MHSRENFHIEVTLIFEWEAGVVDDGTMDDCDDTGDEGMFGLFD